VKLVRGWGLVVGGFSDGLLTRDIVEGLGKSPIANRQSTTIHQSTISHQ
jgi:hypothetical protein